MKCYFYHMNVYYCSGDTDSVVPLTATWYSIDALNLSTVTNWHPWYDNQKDMLLPYLEDHEDGCSITEIVDIFKFDDSTSNYTTDVLTFYEKLDEFSGWGMVGSE